MMTVMSEITGTDSELRMLAYELAGLVGPRQTIELLVQLLEAVRATGAFPQGLPIDIDGPSENGEDVILVEIAQNLAPYRR
jgi:hypothetical protein